MASKIEIGNKIPMFSLQNQDGDIIDISHFLGKKNLVIYFYPKNDTQGCTKEACSFRDSYEDFKQLGAEVIGISGDSEKSHQSFSQRHRLPFILLSDADNTVRKQFGVPTNLFGMLPGRVTYITDKQGIVQYIFNSQINVHKHVSKAIEILKTLH